MQWYTISRIGRLKVVLSVLSKLVYKVNGVPIKIPRGLFLKNKHSKIYIDMQRN